MDIHKKHRDFLKDYQGLKYGFGEEGHYRKGHQWTTTKYKDKLWAPDINLIGERKDRLKIEFDDDKPNENLEKVRQTLIKNGWGFTKSTHKGKCDYLWIEFTRDMKDKEKEEFLKWIAPEASEIDLNFASTKKVFPVMYAPHWKHSYQTELPIEVHEGEKINYDSLDVKTSPDNFNYETFKKSKIFTRLGQAQEFISTQPIFYDKARLWWIWNTKGEHWELTDETDILNEIQKNMEIDVVSSKSKSEIIASLELMGRKNVPEIAPLTWIQFKNGIIDILQDSNSIPPILKPNSHYFITNPIPWEIGESDETPIIDEIFKEWVGKDYVQTLYEILAYCLLPDYPIHRIFCLVGAGLNGKSKYLELLRKFVGEKNVTCTELDVLLNSRFEVTRLHKKLVCQMGETNFNEMNKTSMLKKLSGGDLIGFEYKRKDHFEDKNYAKIVISTNNLPTTNDKTIGFYRRWLIVDFPNQFTEKVDILERIPDKEYENLSRKCIKLLKKLLKKREFTNDGSVEERMKRYEDHSDPIEKFMSEHTEEDINGHIWKFEFEKKLNQWCSDNRFRNMSEMIIGKKMKQKGIKQEHLTADWLIDGVNKQIRAWIGIKWKEVYKGSTQGTQAKQLIST